MKITIDIKTEGGVCLIETSVQGRDAAHHAEVDPPTLGATLGPVIQRIYDRRTTIETVPEGMILVPVMVSWLAASQVVVQVPENTPEEGVEHRAAIASSIKQNGLPEVVDNPTITFVSAMHAYAPPTEEGYFQMCPETEFEID